MNVFIDTNSLEKRNLQNDVFLESVFDYCEKYGTKVYISKIVLTELTHHKIREFDYIKQFMRKWGNVYRRLANEDIRETFTDIDVKERIKELLTKRGVVEFVGNVAEDIDNAVESLYLGRKPAKASIEAQGLNKVEPEVLEGYAWRGRYEQNGMKDVFIWRSFVKLVQDHPDDAFVFISENKADFAAPKKKGGKSEEVKEIAEKLHEQLCEDLGDSIERVVYLIELDDFVNVHVKKIDEFSETAALGALQVAPDLVAEALSDMGFEEAQIISCTGVLDKSVRAFRVFECVVETQVKPTDRAAIAVSFRTKVKATAAGYDLESIEVIR